MSSLELWTNHDKARCRSSRTASLRRFAQPTTGLHASRRRAVPDEVVIVTMVILLLVIILVAIMITKGVGGKVWGWSLGSFFLQFGFGGSGLCFFWVLCFRVSGLCFRVLGLCFRVLDFGFRVTGLCFRVGGLGPKFIVSLLVVVQLLIALA